MTVVAVLRELNEGILLAADSEATGDAGLKSRMLKVRQIKSLPLAWACKGNPAIGLDRFGQWLTRYDFTNAVWDKFSEDAFLALAELNRQQRERTRKTGAEVTDDLLSDCIIAGWLDRPDMYVLSDDGNLFSVWEQGFYSMGSGGPAARIAFSALFLNGLSQPESVLKIVMEAATALSPQCGPPVQCLRITQKGVKQAFRLEQLALQSRPGSNEP